MTTLAELIAAKKAKALEEAEGHLHDIKPLSPTIKEETFNEDNAYTVAGATSYIEEEEEVEKEEALILPTNIKLSLKELMLLKTQSKPAAPLNPTIILPTEALQKVEEQRIEAKTEVITEEVKAYGGAFSLSISLNDKQLLAKELAFSGKSFCLVGAAGTGKTTAQREIAKALVAQNLLRTHTFKIQGTKDYVVAPSIAFVAYTRIASGNLKKAIHKDSTLASLLEHNVTTIHNLLEYAPETYFDAVDNKEKFRFVPRRTASNPLDITHLIVEESSMVGLDLWEKFFAALRTGVQIIFIGDINQLPPVFGTSVLNYGLVQLPVVCLTEVYRQAGDSLVLKNAHNILAGSMVEEGEDYRIIEGGNVQHSQSTLSVALGKQFPTWMDKGIYSPEEDIILSPWNKHQLGTTNMNNWIAQELGKRRNATVFEIVTGIAKIYLAVGDKVMYNKQVGTIAKISRNSAYRGKPAQREGTDLTRFGIRVGKANDELNLVEASEEEMFAGYENISLDEMLNEDSKDKVLSSSHIVDLELETGEVHTLSSVGDFSPANFTLGYCLTVHKAQGCEWRRVFLIMHRDHKISLSRELFYTASTRAREQVYLIAKKSVIESAIKSQRIKGNTVEEKIEFFNSGLMEAGKTVRLIK